MATTATNFSPGTWNLFGNTNSPSTGVATFGTNTNFQTPFQTPTTQQQFTVFPNNTNSNGVFGSFTTPAQVNTTPTVFTLQQTNPTPTTTPTNVFGGTTSPVTWNFCNPPPPQQPAPQTMFFNAQPLQPQNSPPPIFTFPNQPQTQTQPLQLQQPQQNVIQPVQPPQISPPPSTPQFSQSIPNPQLYKSFLEEKMGLLMEEYRKLGLNQLVLTCPNSNPLVGCGIASPQYFPPQPAAAPKLTYLPCDVGRPSTMALDYVQGVERKLEAEKFDRDFPARLLWRNNRDRRYPWNTVSSNYSSTQLCDANVKRSWGSTCLSDQYRDSHCHNCCCCSQHQLRDIWSPRYPQPLSSPLNDKNYLKQRTQSWRRGYTGYSYLDKDRRPQLNRFRVDGASYTNLDNLYLSQVRGNYVQPPTLKDEADKKWKTLDAKMVRLSDETRRKLGQEWDAEKRVQSVKLQPPLKTYGTHLTDLSNEIDPRDREDCHKIWEWFRQRRMIRGPPLKSHMDDEDLDFYENLRREANKMRPETKIVANLPKRFADWKDNQRNINWSVKSTPPPQSPLLQRPKIVKSNSRLLTPTKKPSEICKEEVRTLYRNLKKGVMVNHEESRVDAASNGTSSVPLEEKTSPVFLTLWKNDRCATTSSTAIQTDKPFCDKQRFPFTMGSFTEENQSARQSKETREQCTQRLREMDPYRCLRGRGPRIGEQPPKPQDEIFPPASNDPPSSKRAVVTLSRPGYYCIPNIDTLNKRGVSKDWSCVWVKDFEIGHNVHGKAVFPGYTNVYGLDLDKIVNISHKTFELYPDPKTEPPFGKGLHKPCTVTLYNIWPTETEKDKTVPSNLVTDPETVYPKFEKFLKKCCKKFNGTFLNYCPEHAEWVFRVQEGPSQIAEEPLRPLTRVDSNEEL